jgi:hypothetical protein
MYPRLLAVVMLLLVIFTSVQCRKNQIDIKSQEELLQGTWQFRYATYNGDTTTTLFYGQTAVSFQRDTMVNYSGRNVTYKQVYFTITKADPISRQLIPVLIFPATSMMGTGYAKSFAIRNDTLHIRSIDTAGVFIQTYVRANNL